jgi:hypothetical protein
VEKSSTFLLEIIILVSSVNKIGSDKVFIVGGRSFIYIKKKAKALKLNPEEPTKCFTVPHFEEIFSNDFISIFCFLFGRYDLNHEYIPCLLYQKCAKFL